MDHVKLKTSLALLSFEMFANNIFKRSFLSAVKVYESGLNMQGVWCPSVGLCIYLRISKICC